MPLAQTNQTVQSAESLWRMARTSMVIAVNTLSVAAWCFIGEEFNAADASGLYDSGYKFACQLVGALFLPGL